MLYFSCFSQVSSPVESFAERITIWYSATVNCASIFTPRSADRAAIDDGDIDGMPAIGLGSWISGPHGSCSQYSTRRGAPICSTCSNTLGDRVFTSPSCSTSGTGTIIANASGGPL